MAGPERTQKEAAQKYQGNLNYLNRRPFFRRLRLWAFVLAVLGSLGAVASFRFWGRQEFFNPGPLSRNHASLAQDCQKCHQGAEWDLIAAAQKAGLRRPEQMARLHRLRDSIAEASLTPWEQLWTKITGYVHPDKVLAMTTHALETSSLAEMDQACVKCHDAQRLHAPQSMSLALRGWLHEVPVVLSGGCANCHREHVSNDRMKEPGDEGCATCHNDAQQMKSKLLLVSLPGKTPRRAGAVELGEGVQHFVAPPTHPRGLPLFTSFAGNHPAFAYERADVADPGTIKFNHRRHFDPEIPPLNGHRLDCSDCHLPSKTGAFMERISYKEHCSVCHPLQVDPSMPTLYIPHADPSAIRSFIYTLQSQINEYGLRVAGITNPADLASFTASKYALLDKRGIKNVQELERRIFYTGDPPTDNERPAPKTNRNQLTIACAKCHAVRPDTGDRPPIVAPPAICDRWLLRGPFTHAAHTNIKCAECHDSTLHSVAAASQSSQTSDILLPKKEMCAACHRALERAAVQPLPTGLSPEAAAAAMTMKQRKEGGVKSDCHSCHKFHSQPESAQFVSTVRDLPKR